jgi:hypothetical protein
MARDLYKNNRFTSSFWFLIFIPIGMVAAFYLYDLGSKIYFQTLLDKDTLSVFTSLMDYEKEETKEEQKEFIINEFKEIGYELDDINLIEQEDGSLVIVTYRRYMSIVGTLSNGILRSKNKLVSSSYRGYYNEYKETVIEKYTEDVEEDIE